MQKLAWADDHPEVLLATSVRHFVVIPPGPARVPPAGGGGGGGGRGGGPQTGPSQTKLVKSPDKGLTWPAIPGGGLPPAPGAHSLPPPTKPNPHRRFRHGNPHPGPPP